MIPSDFGVTCIFTGPHQPAVAEKKCALQQAIIFGVGDGLPLRTPGLDRPMWRTDGAAGRFREAALPMGDPG